MYIRFLAGRLLESLLDSPVALVTGARQTGKTTLAQQVVGGASPTNYITLDESGYLSAATNDPTGFLSGLTAQTTIIDEIQRAPGLLTAIKAIVDRDRRPGRFLLTGSTNILLVPNLSESLAGRMEILTLWALSQAEIMGAGAEMVDRLFQNSTTFPTGPPLSRVDLTNRMLAGGYPEPLARPSEHRRRAWFSSYVTAILQRDVRDLASIEGLTEMPRLLALLASRCSSLLNSADISRSIGIPYTTLNRYMSLLQATYLVQLLPAWSSNVGIRLVKSPKLLVNDTGLAASLIGLDQKRLLLDNNLFGQLFENFVIMEIIKLSGVSAIQPQAYYYRTTSGSEVDLVLEAPDGRLIAIEVKPSATVSAKDFRGLRLFADATSSRFCRGIVVYTGDNIIPFAENLTAIPVQTLWSY